MASRPPTAPDDLDAAARRLWRDTWRALDAQGTWQPHDVAALARYVRAEQTARAMRAVAREAPFTTGSTGQLVPHPGWKVAAEADRDAAQRAAELLLTPAARKRAGLAGPSVPELDVGDLGLG